MARKTNHQSNQKGFTVIELVVVIVIAGILLALILITHAGIAQKERNIERQRDVSELRDEMEAYYSQYNKYPTLANVNDTHWRATNMKALDKEVLRDPSGTAYTLADNPAKGVYAFQVTSAAGTACDNQQISCTQYTLTATLEGGGTFVKNNLN